jgi:hypothetical protein
MKKTIAESLSRFTPLSLEALNDKAAMLVRLDNKYIVPEGRMGPALAAFADLFDVLQIEGRRAFTYATRYYDDAARRAYFDHHQGRRKRCKVRVRHYLESRFSYLEVKLKDTRDVTVKRRLPVPFLSEVLDDRAQAFIDTCHRDLYGEGYDVSLEPVVAMEYRRITLVAKQGGERMTIDTDLTFGTDRGLPVASPGMFILETKSARGYGLADAILRRLHLRATGCCSKYCVAMAALGDVSRRNRFLPALRRLNLEVPVPFEMALAA